jgi:hypothetical protein
MAVDFTKYLNIAAGRQETPVEQNKAQIGTITPKRKENALKPILEGQNEEHAPQLVQLQKKAVENKKQVLRIWERYRENRKKAHILEIEITKGIQKGVTPVELLLKACKAISCMTGTEAFYTQAERDIYGVYGQILKDPQALQAERKAVYDRLDKLKAALSERPPTEAKRIRTAIKAHEERAQEIQQALTNQA